MKIYGFELPSHIEGAALAWLALQNGATASGLEHELVRFGIPHDNGGSTHWGKKFIAHRVADRLLQKWRKEGLITHKRRGSVTVWKPVVAIGKEMTFSKSGRQVIVETRPEHNKEYGPTVQVRTLEGKTMTVPVSGLAPLDGSSGR